MLINPSTLINNQKYNGKSWHYVKMHHSAFSLRFYRVICNHGKRLSATIFPSTIPPIESFHNVVMIADRWYRVKINGEESVIFWIGACDLCDRVYWGCDKLDWIEWLSDFQTVKMVLNATPTIAIRVNGRSNIVVYNSNVAFEPDGRLLIN